MSSTEEKPSEWISTLPTTEASTPENEPRVLTFSLAYDGISKVLLSTIKCELRGWLCYLLQYVLSHHQSFQGQLSGRQVEASLPVA